MLVDTAFVPYISKKVGFSNMIEGLLKSTPHLTTQLCLESSGHFFKSLNSDSLRLADSSLSVNEIENDETSRTILKLIQQSHIKQSSNQRRQEQTSIQYSTQERQRDKGSSSSMKTAMKKM